jgi:hypothetical protein
MSGAALYVPVDKEIVIITLPLNGDRFAICDAVVEYN